MSCIYIKSICESQQLVLKSFHEGPESIAYRIHICVQLRIMLICLFERHTSLDNIFIHVVYFFIYSEKNISTLSLIYTKTNKIDNEKTGQSKYYLNIYSFTTFAI